MITASPMQTGDIARINVHESQIGIRSVVGTDYENWLLSSGPAFTVEAGGEIIGCLGLAQQWDGRAAGWAVLSAGAGRYMLPLTRVVAGYLDMVPYRRIEAYVDAHFRSGCRWAHRLGFVLETPTPMKHFFQTGNDAYMYARTR